MMEEKAASVSDRKLLGCRASLLLPQPVELNTLYAGDFDSCWGRPKLPARDANGEVILIDPSAESDCILIVWQSSTKSDRKSQGQISNKQTPNSRLVGL